MTRFFLPAERQVCSASHPSGAASHRDLHADWGGSEMHRRVFLPCGLMTLVSAEDFEWVDGHTWRADMSRYGYPKAVARTECTGGRSRKTIKLHREILGVTNPRILVDHIDGNPLNNVRENLRVVTAAENARNFPNRVARRRARGEFVGVSLHQDGKYRAYITVNNKRIDLGLFAQKIDAARARDAAARELHGAFASLNFRDGSP